jgi:Predicted pPIWI-associating nuclease
MTSPHPAAEAWSNWWNEIDALLTFLYRGKGLFVSSHEVREQAKAVVQYYFREVRPQLVSLSLPEGNIDELDWICQYLLKLSSATSRKSTYRTRLRELRNVRGKIGSAIEVAATEKARATTLLLTPTEAAIHRTLDKLIPSAALSYRQVLKDLAESDRASYRGTAAEVREVLREVLDHFAPDDAVLQSGISLEKGLTRPTMKQKATFILKARHVGESQRKPAEDSVQAVQESVGAIARSVYTRGSLSTHVSTTRKEVLSFKGYADAVLADLLEIHQ